MHENTIEVRGVGKLYRTWESPASRLSSAALAEASKWVPLGLSRRLRDRSQKGTREFHALKDVSFTVRRGEALGIIGRNGSGKSTLLQIIAGTLRPSTGEVTVRGRVAALLELGSGFNPEFTGQENVYLNATVLGLTREQIDARYNEIVAFAEIGDFIDQPIKTYSSGMVMRLAFAVAVHVEPDILIVDEALSVGDARFQLKCARAIDRFIAKGITFLFVSHDASMIKRLCNTAVLLERGNLLYAGKPNDVVNLYSKLVAEDGSAEALREDIVALTLARSGDAERATPSRQRAAPIPVPPESATVQAKHIETILADERAHVQVSGHEFSYGGELGRIHAVVALGANEQPHEWFTTGDRVVARMIVEAFDACPDPIFGLTIKNAAGVEVYGTNTLFSNQLAPPLAARERREVNFTFDLHLMPGTYFFSFGFAHFVGDDLVVYHRRYDALRIEVHGRDRTFGIANLHAAITSRPVR